MSITREQCLFVMAQAQPRRVCKKTESVSLSAEFLTHYTPREAPGATPAASDWAALAVAREGAIA